MGIILHQLNVRDESEEPTGGSDEKEITPECAPREPG